MGAVAAGTFQVTQRRQGGPDALIRVIGADEVFGEIGLLRGSPRTATVTAETDGVLLELDGADFLSLVGAGGAVRARFLGLSQRPWAPNR